MSLNDEQRAYVDELRRMPLDQKCWCAWFPVGQCHSCPPDLTAAMRAAVECPECHNYPPASDPTRPVNHNRMCSRRTPETPNV